MFCDVEIMTRWKAINIHTRLRISITALQQESVWSHCNGVWEDAKQNMVALILLLHVCNNRREY